MLGGLVIALALFGTVYIIATWLAKRANRHCPKYRYIYKPQARTFVEEQNDPASVYKMYEDLFTQVGPWSSTWSNPYERDKGGLNPFILGGLATTDLASSTRESQNFLN